MCSRYACLTVLFASPLFFHLFSISHARCVVRDAASLGVAGGPWQLSGPSFPSRHRGERVLHEPTLAHHHVSDAKRCEGATCTGLCHRGSHSLCASLVSCSLSLDLRTRDAAYRLYRLLWGRDTPSCASDSQRHAGVQLDGYFKSRRATTQERAWSRIARATEVRREDARHAGRRQSQGTTAHLLLFSLPPRSPRSQYVQSLREPREFTVPTYRNNSSHNRGKAKRQKIAHAAAGHAEHAEDEEAEPIDY